MTAQKQDINLFHYKYGLLGSRSQKNAEKLLESSEALRTRLNRIDRIMEAPVEFEAPNNLNLILEKAGQIERNPPKKSLFDLIPLYWNSRILVPVTAACSLILGAAVIIILNNPFAKDTLFITRTFGNVSVNNHLFTGKNFQFDLSRKWDLSTSEGGCLVQLNREKLLYLGKNTRIQIKASSSLKVEFIKGTMIGRVIKGAKNKRLVIQASGGSFTIVGTIFSIRKESNLDGPGSLEFAVREGKVEYKSRDKTTPISKNEKITIENGISRKDRLSPAEGGELDTIKQSGIISNFNGMEKVSIRVLPDNSDIFLKNDYLGPSPAFMIIPKKSSRDLIIKKDGYMDQGIKQDGSGQNRTIVLEKSPVGSSRPMRSYVLSGDQLITKESPLLIDDFDGQKGVNMVGGETGAFDNNPTDSETYCRAGFQIDNDLHRTGYHLKLSYNVRSQTRVNNGYMWKLDGINLSGFKGLSFWIKGDAERDFSTRFKIEIRDNDKNSIRYTVRDITSSWKTVIIPLTSFQTNAILFNNNDIQELLFEFDDTGVDVQKGRYLIDDVCFIPSTGTVIRASDLFTR
jgi:hypothetical protein